MSRLFARAVQIGIPLIVVLGAAWSVYAIWSAGGFDAEIVSRLDGACTRIEGVVGPEDIVIDRAAGQAYISGRDLRAAAAARDGQGTVPPGAIYRYDLRAAAGQALPVNLTPDAPASFQPHGLSLVRDGDGLWLLAVNHPGAERHEVIRYRVTAEGLAEDARWTSPLLISPNDLHAVDRDRFYVTNDRGSGARFMHAVESFLHLPRSTVVYFDGGDWWVAADGIVFANGIDATADNALLLVGSVVERQVYLFARAPDGGLALQDRLEMPMGPDNISRAADGSFWIAGHPKLFTFVAHAGDPAAPSPGMVVRTRLTEEGAQVAEVLRDDGGLMSAMSVAVPYDGNRLLIGGVFAGYFLDCTMSAAAMAAE